MNIIADMLAEHAQALKIQAEMSTSTNNAVVATNVLSQNIETAIRRSSK